MLTSEIRLSFDSAAAPYPIAGFPASDILPVIPPGARLSEGSTATPGKSPGRYRIDGSWSGLPDWRTGGVQDPSASTWPTANIGLRTTDFPAIDCDTNSTEALALVERTVLATVPGAIYAPVRYRENAPRAAYAFRLAGSVFKKWRIVFRDAGDKEHACELLADGQHYVVSGTHHSGAEIKWRDGKDLTVVGVSGLPTLSAETARELKAALEKAIRDAGWKIVSTTGGDAQGQEQGVTVRDADPAVDDTALALEALQAIPNTAETLPSREDLVALLSSFKSATGREADTFYPDVVAWASEHGWADEPYVEKIWDSLTTVRVSSDHLIAVARKHGWRGDAAMDFKEFGPDEIEIIRQHSGGPLALFAPEKSKPDLAAMTEVLRNHAPGIVAFDEMSGDVVLMRPLRGEPNFAPRPLVKADVLIVQEAAQRGGLRRVGKDTVEDALFLIANENRFHPVRDYLHGLNWDGVERATQLFPRYFGSEDSEYTREVGRMMLIGMVARVMRPPVKVDNTVILEGRQRTRKSMAIGILGGKWFSDHLPDIGSKDASIHLRGRWVVEIPEMTAISKADANAQKSFMTRVTERFRRPYDRREVEEPRQNIFIGTTNETEYLRDATGGRRWWPVRTGVLDTDALARDRDQLLAEALVRFDRGEKWYADGEFEDRVLSVEQEARYEADPWEEPIADFVHGKDRLTNHQIALGAVGLAAGLVHSGVGRRIGAVMKRLGWDYKKVSANKRAWLAPGI